MRRVDETASRPGNLAARLRQAFLDHGYEQMTMSGLAQLCGFSRRALYHHFSNKEEAFRYWLEFYGHESIAAGLAAGRAVMEAGGSAVDVMVETMNVRYGTPAAGSAAHRMPWRSTTRRSAARATS